MNIMTTFFVIFLLCEIIIIKESENWFIRLSIIFSSLSESNAFVDSSRTNSCGFVKML